MRTATCPHCQVVFPVKSGRKPKYCCHECFAAHRRTRVACACEVCGAAYECRISRAPASRFCSWKCQQEARKDQVAVTCGTCGKEFTRKRCYAGGPRYCSRKCLGLSQRERVQWSCEQCGKTFTERPCYAGKRVVCSIACRAAARRKDKIPHTCLKCGKVFMVFPYRTEEARFCCQACGISYRGETAIEKAVRLALDALGVTYDPQHRVGTRVLDFYLPGCATALEVDGLYWHDPVRDARRDKVLLAKGIKTIRISDAELKTADAASLVKQKLGLS